MKQLSLSIGEYSSQGRKAINQDFYDIRIPPEPLLTTKGIAIAIADGISSSRVSQEASKVSVNSFLEDYYSTSEALSVKKSAQQVIYATNSWIYAQNRQNQYHLEKDRGYVCTFTAMVIKSNSAYIFHVGDARIYRLRDGVLTQLTQDHRIWVSKEQSYLSRAMGIDSDLRIDYASYDIQERDLYLFMTDGVYEYLSSSKMVEMAKSYADDLPAMAKEMVEYAYTQGSGDNLTLQVVHIDTLAEKSLIDIQRAAAQKPFPPTLKARDEFDGYTIVRKLSDTPRSRVYLALDKSNQDPVVLKAASLEFQEDKEYIERFLLEEWIA
ncbi:MAG TPA: bifunctional protein-serine/threonine kinase/phosphatase, partial [Nitratifractor sp.]|nr:bifunctional protein-serine/threonine kinase/phosphatase [Nitratifractor sp.]